jgi:glycosyltransferase involved in cell wall biosynthesis
LTIPENACPHVLARIQPPNLSPVAPTTEVVTTASPSSVGLVHDYLLVMRGAERTFAEIAACWPDAPVYTSLYSEAGTERRFAGRRIRTSPLQALRPGQAHFRLLLPLYPWAMERLPVGGPDLLVSSSSAFAHGVRPGPGASHVCYCHTPFRYAWHEYERAVREAPWALRFAVRTALDRLRRWDREASRRVGHYVANSALTQQRIWEAYGRESVVVHPPVEVERFSVGTPQAFFLVVAELVGHKRVDVALEAARRAGVSLKVIGEGPDLGRLRSIKSNAEFLGRVPDGELERLYSKARAVVVPSIEEFGIVAVEGQAAGRPVLAVDAGGARETVINGETGVLVPPDDPDALAEALREVDFDAFAPTRIREHAKSFSADKFREKFNREVAAFLAARG